MKQLTCVHHVIRVYVTDTLCETTYMCSSYNSGVLVSTCSVKVYVCVRACVGMYVCVHKHGCVAK